MIKLFLTDIDGCLTDGGYYLNHSEHGASKGKRYFTRDFHGLEILHNSGVKIGFVTGSKTAVDNERVATAAPYAGLYQGISNKLDLVHNEFIQNGFCWSEISYIGDDVPDIDLLNRVGWAACPLDAHKTIQEFVMSRPDGLCLDYNGGYGCVRQFADLVLEYNNRKQNASN